MPLIDDLVAACASKEPAKIALAFNELMIGKTFERIQAEKQNIAQTMFNTPKEESADGEVA